MIVSPVQFAIRYRVARLRDVAPGAGGPGQETAMVDEVREFRTLDGADRYQDQLLADGKPTVLQYGLLRWMTHAEVTAEARRLQAEGGRLQ